jgi:transposase
MPNEKKRSSKLDAFKPLIKHYLEEDPQVCAPIVFEKIKYRGYTGGATMLREHLRAIRGESKSKEVFLRIEPQPGEEVQVDWGHFAAITYGNTSRKLYALAASSPIPECSMWSLPILKNRRCCIIAY